MPSRREAGGAGGCEALSVAYQVDYVPEQHSYLVTGAQVTGLGPGCVGRTTRSTSSWTAGLGSSGFGSSGFGSSALPG